MDIDRLSYHVSIATFVININEYICIHTHTHTLHGEIKYTYITYVTEFGKTCVLHTSDFGDPYITFWDDKGTVVVAIILESFTSPCHSKHIL